MIHIFIINSHAGNSSFSVDLRSHLATRTDIDHYIFHTRQGHTEKELVEEVLELFEDEYIRIYSCGGSGTFCNIMNGIKDFSKVELAFYPMGLTNDFLKSFGKDEKYFRDIDALIDGSTIDIDYIKTNHGVCLNTFSTGLDLVQVQKTDDFRSTSVFGKKVPYLLGFLYAIAISKPDELEILYGDGKCIGRFSQVFFGNGGVIGGTLWFEKEPDFKDGKGFLTLFRKKNSFEMIHILNFLSRQKTEKISQTAETGYYPEITIRRRDGIPIKIDFDGELQEPQQEWTARIVPKGLKFVIPKGVDDKWTN